MISRKVINFFKRFYPITILYDSAWYLNHVLNDGYSVITRKTGAKSNAYWYNKIKETQVRKKLPLFLDRQFEVTEFFKISHLYLIYYFFRNGFPHTDKYKDKWIKIFGENTGNDDDLTKAYNECSFYYTLRLMLGYERYSDIAPHMDFILDKLDKPVKDLKVLDYGCGVSDIGLLFASLGADVTIADLNNEKIEFTIRRFTRRKLNPQVIRIDNCQDYPALTASKFDLVIATEIFEHVRNPLLLLKNLTYALIKNGFLFDTTDGKLEDRAIGEDHLREAVEMGLSKEYKDWYKNNYRRVFNRLFEKIT